MGEVLTPFSLGSGLHGQALFLGTFPLLGTTVRFSGYLCFWNMFPFHKGSRLQCEWPRDPGGLECPFAPGWDCRVR